MEYRTEERDAPWSKDDSNRVDWAEGGRRQKLSHSGLGG